MLRCAPVHCSKHDLAGGPDGRCVLCRKEKPSRRPSARPAPRRRIGALVLSGVLLAAAGATAAIVTASGHATSPGPPIQLGIARAGFFLPGAGTTEPPVAVAPATAAQNDPSVAWLQAVARGEPSASSVEAPPAPPDTPPPAPAPTTPSWQEARDRVHVVVYTTGWCPHCKRAKAWMDESGVSYEERNIESSAQNAEENRALNPRGSIPTFDVDGDVMVGFSEANLVAMIERAAQRHGSQN
jgi:glutaredoxin 3